jgi:hypothetical protein
MDGKDDVHLVKDLSGSASFFIIFVIITSYRSAKKTKEVYHSHRLIIEADHLSRNQSNLLPVTIPFNEITQITEDKRGILIIRGQEGDAIAASPYLENYDKVKKILQTLHPITQPEIKNIFYKYPTLLTLLMIGCIVVIYISNNKIIVALSGGATLGIMAWLFYKINTTRQIDVDIKRNSWAIILTFAAVVAAIYYKVFVM